jgi:tRNA (cmo5U34)-methyltransferase
MGGSVTAAGAAATENPADGVVGDGLRAESARWSFGGDVSRNFDAHVERSVPRYHEGHQLILELSDFFLASGSACFEIGCSTGALTRKLAERHVDREVAFTAIDVEPDMVEVARSRCAGLGNVEVVSGDAAATELDAGFDLVLAYYTIQFIPPKHRQDLVSAVFEALNWGGAFVMFEKVRAPDARFQDLMSQLYGDYKLANGYTPAEIMSKTRSLKGVLEPFSTQGNLDLLRRAGFEDVMSVMKSVCFEGFLAIK